MVIVAAIGLSLTACQRTPPPIDPHDAAVIDARDRARQDMDAEVNAIQRVLGARQFSRIEANTCQAGRNDWKTTDPFFSRCEFDVAVGLAYDGDFRQQVEALDELLSSRGWTGLLAASHSLWMWDGEAQSIAGSPAPSSGAGEPALDHLRVYRDIRRLVALRRRLRSRPRHEHKMHRACVQGLLLGVHRHTVGHGMGERRTARAVDDRSPLRQRLLPGPQVNSARPQ
jgi:hypothetical protein